MSRSLVVGASGLVGSHLMSHLLAEGHTASGTYLSQRGTGLSFLDYGDLDASSKLLALTDPEIIYFPAANPNVEWAEANPEAARLTNVALAQRFLVEAAKTGAKLVYFSSEYVFDGQRGPYAEADKPCPINTYGLLKHEMEDFVLTRFRECLVVRTTVVYGWEPAPKNYVQRLLDTLRSGASQVKVPSDQVSTPTHAVDLARVAVELAGRTTGILHVCGDARCSRYELALAVAEAFGLAASGIDPVPTAKLSQLARRPLDAGLKVDGLRELGITPPSPYKPGLANMRALEPAVPFTDAEHYPGQPKAGN